MRAIHRAINGPGCWTEKFSEAVFLRVIKTLTFFGFLSASSGKTPPNLHRKFFPNVANSFLKRNIWKTANFVS